MSYIKILGVEKGLSAFAKGQIIDKETLMKLTRENQ
jgi:hypothetical protein